MLFWVGFKTTGRGSHFAEKQKVIVDVIINEVGVKRCSHTLWVKITNQG